MSRLGSRLSKLERKANPEPVDADGMLVTLLGRRDGLLWPWRVTSSDDKLITARGAIKIRQNDYFEGRIGFSARADGKSDWKTAYEQRGQLITSGLVTAIRSGGEVTALRLTPQGEADARALVGPRLKTMRDVETLHILKRCIDRQGEMSQWFAAVGTAARYMVEWLVLGIDEPLYGNPADWEHLTELTLPLLTAGYLQASSDSHGRVYYSLVYDKEGKQIFGDRIELGPISTRQHDPKWDAVYMDAFTSECRSLERLESHELHIPLPCSGSWMEWQTRAVRMRNAIEYPTYPGHMKHDFSEAGRFKTLANEVLADDKATAEEREFAVKLLQVITDGVAGHSRAREAHLKTQAVANG